MKTLSKEKQELVDLAKDANLLNNEMTQFGSNNGVKTILCDSGNYYSAFELKMLIDPSGNFANME